MRKLYKDVEARRNLLPKGTSLHSSPLAAPLMIKAATFYTIGDMSTSNDEVSPDPAPDPEASPASSSILQRLLSAPPKPSPSSAPRVNFHSIDTLL